MNNEIIEATNKLLINQYSNNIEYEFYKNVLIKHDKKLFSQINKLTKKYKNIQLVERNLNSYVYKFKRLKQDNDSDCVFMTIEVIDSKQFTEKLYDR